MIWSKVRVKREQALGMIPAATLREWAKHYGCRHIGSYQIRDFLVAHWNEEICARVLRCVDYMLREPIEMGQGANGNSNVGKLPVLRKDVRSNRSDAEDRD